MIDVDSHLLLFTIHIGFGGAPFRRNLSGSAN
jgi:hypothetical protein